MRFACLPLAVLAPVLVPACREADAGVDLRIGVHSVEVDGTGLSAGGLRVDDASPTLFYGSVLDRGTRRYTYLVVGPPVDVASDAAWSNPSRSTYGDGALASTQSFLRRGEPVLTATYDARATDDGAVVDERRTLQGADLPLERGWLFLFDFEDPDSGLTPVDVAMPKVPADGADLDGFTEMFVADLVRRNADVAAFVER
jgi:hypothetical protein